MDKLKNLFLQPVIIGHRGYRARYPENTMAGFEAAMDAGADMIELDVHLTRDNQLVVIHDEKVDRTTNGKGRVSDFTLKELKQLDAGKWFDAAFSGEQIPILSDVLDLIRGKLCINIEIKAVPENKNVPYETGNRLLEVIKEKKAREFCIVSSFNMALLQHLRGQSASLSIGVLTYTKRAGLLKICEEIRATAWHPHYKNFTRKELDQAKSMGLIILPYTVNAGKDMQQLLEMGVHGFFTDDPVVGKRVMKQVLGDGLWVMKAIQGSKFKVQD